MNQIIQNIIIVILFRSTFCCKSQKNLLQRLKKRALVKWLVGGSGVTQQFIGINGDIGSSVFPTLICRPSSSCCLRHGHKMATVLLGFTSLFSQEGAVQRDRSYFFPPSVHVLPLFQERKSSLEFLPHQQKSYNLAISKLHQSHEIEYCGLLFCILPANTDEQECERLWSKLLYFQFVPISECKRIP